MVKNKEETLASVRADRAAANKEVRELMDKNDHQDQQIGVLKGEKQAIASRLALLEWQLDIIRVVLSRGL